VQAGCFYSEVIVPTVDSIRIQYLLNNLLKKNKHTLIVGQTGTGKSITISSELTGNFMNDDYSTLSLSFSAQTSSL
jgi:dynein heavy chain